MRHEPIAVRAQGRWKDILSGLGLDARYLQNRHGPCPQCGGKDRYRFDDKDGKGTYFCSHCGAGDGMQMAQFVTGKPFKEAVKLVEGQLGHAKYQEPKPRLSEDDQRAINQAIWRAGQPLQKGDPAERYLNSRMLSGVGITALRFVPECWHPDTRQKLPALVAAVQGADDRVCALHQTYLTLDGQKADVIPQRRITAGTLSEGASIRLGPVTETLGIAEGIETALAAARLQAKLGMVNMSVWATMTAAMLEKWTIPEGVKKVMVFADKDKSYTGQKAAYGLLHRLARDKRIELEDKLPDFDGQDFNDILIEFENERAE